MERFITWNEINRIAELLIETGVLKKETKVWGVPRGGQYLMPYFTPVHSPEEAEVIIDDLYDSGSTKKYWQNKFPDKLFLCFFTKEKTDKRWYVFPWEIKSEPLEDNIARICQYKGFPIVKNLGELKKLLNKYDSGYEN